MIAMTVKMNTLPAKQRELVQTIHELMEVVCKEHGYMHSHFYRDPENENILILTEEWTTWSDAERHMQSHYFDVLRGALNVLTVSSEISFNPGKDD